MNADDSRCQYQSTNCENPRARRVDGALHRLCELHRDKANETQRRWHSRHKDTLKPPIKQLTPFEKRALARLMAAADRETVRSTRLMKRRRCEQHLESAVATNHPPGHTGHATSDVAGKAELLIDRAIDLSDEEIQSLTSLVMEFNSSNECEFVDDEFVELLESWSSAHLVGL